MSRRVLAGSRAPTDLLRRTGRASRRAARGIEEWLTGELAVLAYHRIAEPVHDPWDLSVSPRNFDEQLGVLRELGVIEQLDVALTASAFARCLRRRPTFALTFDDGYVDNLTTALPVLEAHDAPATIFIATGMLDGPWFWWDVLTDLIFDTSCAIARLVEAAAALGLLSDEWVTSHVGDRATLHDELYEALVQLPTDEIGLVLQELARLADVVVRAPPGRPMTIEELLVVAAHPLITIGIHTVSHPRLTLLSAEQVRAELMEGARRLDELLDEGPRTLAYPYGATSPVVAEIARSTGIYRAVTTDARWVGLREDRLLIPRLHPHDVGRDAFRAWIISP